MLIALGQMPFGDIGPRAEEGRDGRLAKWTSGKDAQEKVFSSGLECLVCLTRVGDQASDADGIGPITPTNREAATGADASRRARGGIEVHRVRWSVVENHRSSR